MNKNPLVSIFIPYYNDKAFLDDSIQSVLNSTYTDFELILLDHASTDEETVKIAHSFSDPRIKHIHVQKNLGAGSGLLLLEFLKYAKGKYVKLFCADDMMVPDGLKTLVDFMENNPDKDFAFGNVEYIDENGNDLNDNWFDNREWFSTKNSEIDLIKIFINGIGCLPYIGNIVKKKAFDVIKVNTTFIMMFDMHLWASMLCKGLKIGYCNEIIAKYRIHKNQMSGLNQEKKAETYVFFEYNSFNDVFFTIENLDIAKKIVDSVYAEKLTNKEDIPFFLAQALFDKICPLMYYKLNNIMNEEESRKRIEKRFGYGVKELRKQVFSFVSDEAITNNNKFKHKINIKKYKNYSVIDISFLVVRKIYNIVMLRDVRRFFRRKSIKKKKYSL